MGSGLLERSPARASHHSTGGNPCSSKFLNELAKSTPIFLAMRSTSKPIFPSGVGNNLYLRLLQEMSSEQRRQKITWHW
jgi:hypothetical protein